MRDPRRIQPMLDKLARLWYSNTDLRMGQLIENVFHDAMVGPLGPDGEVEHRCIYHIEDDKAEGMLDDAISADGDIE